MGNKILGKRSRNFYRGFNERQINYLREKFQTLSEGGKLKRQLFIATYYLDDSLYDIFAAETDFDESGGIEEYEFICMVSYLCNLSTEQLGAKIFAMLVGKDKSLKEANLLLFTQMCLKYNAYLEGSQVKQGDIKKANRNKFRKYDYDKNKSIDCSQFCNICLKDLDYKNWLYNMGFITKNQMEHHELIYDLVDSDIGEEVDRQLRENNPNVDRIKRGIDNRQQDDQFKPQLQIGQQSALPKPKPWVEGLNKIKADLFVNQFVPNLSEEAPSQFLNLEYVFGYRSFDCRNNLRFDSRGRIVYHQASLGIVLSPGKQGSEYDQLFLNEHKDDITCLDGIGDRMITGESGTTPMIIIWNTEKIQNGSLKSEFIITKDLKDSIGTVCFSPSQRFIAATCNDQDHRLVVFDLKQLKQIENDLTSKKTGIVVSGPLIKCLVFDTKFQLDQKSLAVATIRQLLFVNIQRGVISSSRGDFSDFSPSMALCLLPLSLTSGKAIKKNCMVAGMGNGSIYFWEKGKCIKAIVGHTGSVSAICKRNDLNSFISGDKTGKIIFWGENFSKERTMNLPKTNSPSNMVVSLCHSNKKQLLIGTKGSNILLLNHGEGIQLAKSVMSGHSDGMIWSATLGGSFIFTGGQDQRLIKWDFEKSKRAVKQVKCPFKIRALNYHNKLNLLAVGFINGVVGIYNPENLQRQQKLWFSQIKNPDQEVLNIVRFEYYGRFMAVSYSCPKPKIIFLSFDGSIKVIGQLQLKNKSISFDLSKSDRNPYYLRCNTISAEGETYQVYELSFEKDKIRSKATNQKLPRCEWHTHTCLFTPQTQGFISQGVEEKDLTCCARSLKFKNVIVVGDRYSKLKLFNYPTPFNNIFNKYEGHSNSVTAVTFNESENYLISIGGQEKAIFVWKYDPMLIKNSYVLDRPQEQDDQFTKKVEKGDQALSTPQYKGQIFPPTDFKSNPRKDNKLPLENAKVKHVFGIRSTYLNDNVRNQGKFTANGKGILFPTACMAVQMDIETRQQHIMLEHKQDIVSFAVDNQRTVMATGQMAEKNLKNPKNKILSIYVWDLQTKKSLVRLDGFHTIAVVLLEFSPSGKLLFTCGHDEKNTFAVYDWRAKTILYSGPVSRAKVNGIAWKSEAEFATCGNDHVKFWQNGKGRMGQFAPAKTQGQMCVVSSGSVYITGGGMGNIFVWSGNKGPACIKAHTGKVQCLVERKNFVYSGGSDGKILRWRKKGNGSIENSDLLLDTRAAFPDRKLGKQIQYGILSLDFGLHSNDETYFIITKGCSAVVCSSGKFNIITQGHYNGELWGLATNYRSDLFVTGGDDESVRVWSIDKKKEIYRTDFNKIIRAVDWSPNGDKIICADAVAKIRLLDTSLNLLSQYSGKPAQNNKSGKGFVEQIKFSPNGQMAVYGTHGKSQTIEFLKVSGKSISLLNSFNSGTTSAFLHADWSRSSDAISINTQAAELLMYTVNTSGKCSSASSFRNQPWATWSQKFGFPVQGIYQNPDYSDINTVCRDPLGKFLAVGYDDQCIRLFKYPCYIPKQVHRTLFGHSSHVTRIRFTPNFMVSAGGLDRTIIVWDINRGEEEKNRYTPQQSDDQLSDLDEEVDLPQKIMINRKKKQKVPEEFREIETVGDEFMAIKPWIGAIKQPSYSYPKQTPNAPRAQIQLEYVHGYRVKDCRQNLFFNDEKTLIFHAAAVLIYHDTKRNSQILLADHTDDILSIDYHKPTGGVVTGELGPKPLVNYYRNAKLINSFKAPVTKGILALAISPDGTKAIAIGMDDYHEIALLDLEQGTRLVKQKGGRKVILKVGWVSNDEFVTVGIRHFKHWTISGNRIKGRDGNDPGNLVSLAIGEGKVLTGASHGTIYSWKGNSGKIAVTLKKPQTKNKTKEQNQQLTTSVVESIKIEKSFVAAGTKDGFIFIMSSTLELLACLSITQILKSYNLVSEHPSVRSLDFLNNKMLVGTFGSQIFEIQVDNLSSRSPKVQQAVCHIKCHYSPNNSWTNEVWGLHVDGQLAFTCSDDATLRCWSISERRLLSIASLNLIEDPTKKQSWIQSGKDEKTKDFYDSSKGRSVCISPDRKFIIVGCKDGTVRIFTFDSASQEMAMFQKFKHAKQWISQIKFGFNLLIIGSHDNAIYVYDYDPEEAAFRRKYKPMKKHSSYITHVDVSRDSCYLQSTCGAYQLLFWDLNTGKQITSGASMLRDERWATWTSTLGWPVQGIYPKCTDGTFIHSVDRSNTSVKGTNFNSDPLSPYLLAGGNNRGQVCLYNYPCTIKNSNYVAGIGHSSHITNVRWTKDDERVISVGGEDQCVMYWRVKKNI